MMKKIGVFGGGCFWCTEAVFKNLRGVITVRPGYTGGNVPHPNYLQVSRGNTGHVEVILIEYNPDEISYDDLLTVFFATHDPTTVNRQGNDIGTQYRSAIFYTTKEDKIKAESFIADINSSNTKGKKVMTEVKPLDTFYEAEDYHCDYYEKNKEAPYCQIIINPKLEKVQKQFVNLLKKSG